MKRRVFLLLPAIVLLRWAPRADAFPRRPITEWIRDLYVAEAARIARSQKLDEIEFLALFTPQAGEAWRAAHRRSDPTSPEDATFNAFFGWHVAQGAEAAFVGASKVLGTFDAPTLLVDVVVSGVPRRIVVDAVEDEGGWRIADIAYDEGDNFVGFERKLARR
jgi:hypothetical protein